MWIDADYPLTRTTRRGLKPSNPPPPTPKTAISLTQITHTNTHHCNNHNNPYDHTKHNPNTMKQNLKNSRREVTKQFQYQIRKLDNVTRMLRR
jgi:hypothetical protein